MDLIPTNVNYTYTLMSNNLSSLIRNYPFLDIQTVGTSVMGKNIYVVKLGVGSNHVFYSASIHANEWITSVLLMKFIEDYCKAYVSNSSLYDYNIRQLFNLSTIYLMPMVNPDGVDLVNNDISFNSSYFLNANIIANQFPNISFPTGWKSNINGVDFINFQLI